MRQVFNLSVWLDNGYNFTFIQMAAHVDVDGDCPLALVPCPYSDIGCKFKVRLIFLIKVSKAKTCR